MQTIIIETKMRESGRVFKYSFILTTTCWFVSGAFPFLARFIQSKREIITAETIQAPMAQLSQQQHSDIFEI